MDAHEILVAARNGIDRDGWNVEDFGGDECGTPRCACGWVGFIAGTRIKGAEFYEPTGEYEKAMVALRHTSPVVVAARWAYGLFNQVEAIAFALDREGVDRILEWFDTAISATAPLPPDLDLTEPAEAIA